MRSIKVTSSAFPGERAPLPPLARERRRWGGGPHRWAVGTRATAGAPGSGKGSSTCMKQTPDLLLALREPKTEDAQASTKGGEKMCTLYTHTYPTYTPHPVLACTHINTRNMDMSHTRTHSFTPTTHPA